MSKFWKQNKNQFNWNLLYKCHYYQRKKKKSCDETGNIQDILQPEIPPHFFFLHYYRLSTPDQKYPLPCPKEKLKREKMYLHYICIIVLIFVIYSTTFQPSCSPFFLRCIDLGNLQRFFSPN